MLTVAISQRLFPGEMQVPQTGSSVSRPRSSRILRPERLSIAFDLAGQDLEPDEVAFCDFVP